MRKFIAILTIGLVFGLGVARADVYDIQKQVALYGNLNQNLIPPPNLGASACGPTAAVNSYVYLEQKYPAVYGRLLVPDNNPNNGLYDQAELVAVGTALAGPNYMNTQAVAPGANSGTWDDMFIYGKYQYIEDNAPGTTVYAAQLSSTWDGPGRPVGQDPPIAKPDWVQDNTIPTWQFLYDELVACEDVEILITDSDWGHYLTLTGFHWNDVNNNLTIDANEGTIDYIDPATGAFAGPSPMFQNVLDGQIFVSYGLFPNAQLVMAVSESPIPEPAGLALLGLALLRVRRKRT